MKTDFHIQYKKENKSYLRLDLKYIWLGKAVNGLLLFLMTE